MKDLKQLYERLRASPFPTLAKSIGDFPLYDGLLAGQADAASKGAAVARDKIPMPDKETLNKVAILRKKEDLTADERAFLDYFELLEEIRLTVSDM